MIKPLGVGDLVRVSEFAGVGDFRNKLAVIVEVHGAGAYVVLALLSNRARKAKVNTFSLQHLEKISDEEMAGMSDVEVADIAAWRMGV